MARQDAVDHEGERIGKLQGVHGDVETDEPQFATGKEGLLDRHLTFVPLRGVRVGPEGLQVTVSRDRVRSAPDLQLHGEELSQADESARYHHVEQNRPALRADIASPAERGGSAM